MSAALALSLSVPEDVCPNAPPVRMSGSPAEPLFCLADLCRILGLGNTTETIRRLDQDDLSQAEVIDSVGRQQTAWFVNESGLYTVLLRSDKAQAMPFRRWVTKDVLPSIRRHGCYPPPATPDPLLAGIEQVRLLRLRQIEMEKQIADARAAAEQARARATAALDLYTSNYGYYSVLGWAKLLGMELTVSQASQHGKRLTAICNQAGERVPQVRDPRFGMVNIYPQHILEEYLGRPQS